MSDDQLDNDLRDRIKQVFDDYHDDTAKEGWLLLREKYPEKKKDHAIFWWRMAGVAAFWLLMLNVIFWYKNNNVHPKKIAGNHNTERIDSVVTNIAGVKPIEHDSSPARVKTQKSGISNSTIVSNKQTPVAGISYAVTHIVKSTASSSYQPSFSADSGLKIVPAITKLTTTQSHSLTDSSKTTVGKDNQFLVDKKGPIANPQQAVVMSKSMQQLFDKEDKTKKNTEDQQTTAAKVAFGIYSASYVNYAKGSQRQFNNGAGLSSDIKLTANLSLSTGIAIGQNSLAYNSSTQPTLQMSLALKKSGNFLPLASMLPLVVPTSQNLNASLVNLDIPVNLKYSFNPQTNRTYIVAGLSSGTFINENYNTTYSYNGPDGSTLQQTQDASHKTFDNFYFAQMLNLAMGVGYPLGKNQLVIEPFFKYPLSGLGDQHILFGSAGLNLKFNFDSTKPKK